MAGIFDETLKQINAKYGTNLNSSSVVKAQQVYSNPRTGGSATTTTTVAPTMTSKFRQESAWKRKYGNKKYSELSSALASLEDGDEKEWLKGYAQQVDYDEKLRLDLDAYSREIADLEQRTAQLRNARQGDITAAAGKTAQETLMDLLAEADGELSRKKQYLNQAKQIQAQAAGEQKYADVTKNADFAKMSGYDSGNSGIGYQYVNADLAGRLDLEQKYGQYVKQFSDSGMDSLNDDEKAIYNYYMNTDEQEEAARYLKYLEEELQIRKGTATDAYVDQLAEDDPRAKVLRYAFMANVGYDQHLSGLQGAGNLIAGKDEYVPATATQVAGQLVREDLGQQGKQLPAWLGGGSTGQMLGDLISTTANMAPSMVMGLVSPNAGAAMMGVSAAGGAYQEKINEGFTKEQARKYGIAIGASEAALGAALGGIKSLGGAVTNHVVDNALKGIKNGVGRFFAEWGTRIGSEALEEGIQEILTPMFSNLLLNTDEKVDWSEVAYSALLGGLSAGVLEVGDAYSGAKNATTEKSTAVDDKMSAAQLTEDIDSFAKQYGKQAEAVKQNYLEGQDLKEYEVGFQAAYAIGKESGKKEGLQQVPYLSQAQKEIAFSMGQYAAAVEKRDAEKSRVQKMPKATLTNEDGESSPVSIAEVVSMDDNAMTFRLEDGSTVTDEALTFDKGDQVLSAVWESGMDVKAANAILSDMETNPATDAAQAAGIDEAYRYGSHGYSMEQLVKNGADAAVLTENQRKAAYEAGVIARQAAAVAAPAVKTKKGASDTGVYLDGGSGNVTAFNQKDLEGLTGKRKAGVQAAMALQKIGVGGNFYFYESYVNDAGERVYKDANGVEKIAPNGWYDPKDDRIHIDLNAGADASGLTLYTLSHELTHFVEKRSKEKYQALADFLAESYNKQGESVDALVIAKQKALSESRGEAVGYEEAYSEFIADSMEAMLSDSKVLEKLADLKTKDRGLFDEIRKFFDNLVKKIRDVYAQLVPDSEEGKMVLQMKDQIEQIQQLFAEALAEASENYQAAADTDPAAAGAEMSNEEAFKDSATAVHFQIRPPYADGSKAFNAFVDGLNPDARETFDLFYGFYQRSRITNTVSVSGKNVKAVNISSLYLLAQEWNDMLAKEPKWASAAKELADFLPADVRRRMNMNDDGTLNPTTMEREFKMPSSMAQRLVDALPYESIDAEYKLGDKTVTLPEGKARQSVGGEAYRRAILDETRKLFSEGKLRPVGIGTMSKDRWGSLGFLAANGKTGASGDFTTVCPQMMFNRGCWYCYRRAAMEKGVNNKLVANSVWYTGEILRIKQSDIDALNRNGGLRIQSFGDWMPHFSAMLADVLYDAELRGLQVKIITKEPSMINYIAALRDQGIGKNLYFNLSADYTIERGPAKQAQDGSSLDAVNPERPYMRDADNSFWWKRAMTVEEAAKYREKYPWVNTRIVATDVAEFIRGLKDNRVDVVTGYHGNIRGIERIDSTTGIRKIEVEALGDAGMPRFAFNPVTGGWFTEYEGKTATHKRLAQAIADNGLQMEYYTKTCCITGRCATCEGKCGALARDFNVKNATNRDTQSIAYWQKQMEYAVEPEFGDMTFDGSNPDIRYQDRATGTSNRALLAGALDQLAQKPDEREFLQKYRDNAAELDNQEAKLQELRRQIREISFGKGPRDTQKLKQLQEEATKTANRIDTYDKRLLGLEATVPLKRVLEREKAKANAHKKAAMDKFREETKAAYEGVQSDAEIMEREFLRLMRAYEKQSADTAAKAKKTQKAMDKKQATIDSYKEDLKTMEREFLRVMKGYETAERKNNAFWEGEFKRLMREYEASGRKVDRLEAKVKAQREAARANVDSRRRTVLRNKIRKDIRELQKILDKGNKKRNVKQGMQDFVSKTIATGEILFADLASDTDLIASGIQADMTTEERKLLTEAERYVRRIEELEGNEDMADVLKARKEGYAEVLKQLKPVLERERIRINSTEASKAFDSLVEAYRSLKESADSYIAMAFNPEVLEYLEGIKYKFAGTLVRDMSQEQLQTLHDCYKMVMTTIRDVNKAFVDGRSVQADAEQLVQEFQERKVPVKKMGVVLKNLSDAAGWNYEKLYYALERINSPTLKRLFGNLANSENITMRDVQEAKAFQKEMVEKYHYNDWDVSKKMEQTFLDSNGKEFRLTLGELMALYAYSRREDADRHIEVGGFTFGKTALTDPKPAATYKLTPDQMAGISDLLTPEQKSFAEAMQRYLSKNMGAKGNEVSMKLYGIEMFNEENYFPLHVAGEYKAKAQESQAKANAGFQSMSNAGFTKARNTNATAPIVLEDFMSVWADHVNEMSRYHGAVPALEDIRRVMNYSVYSDAMAESVSVTAAMTNAYGKQAVKYFDDLYREANSGAVTDRMDAASKKMLSLFRKNSVAYSASVVIQQPTSIFRAKAMIDGKYFGAHGMFTLTGGVLRILNRKKWNAAYADMMKYAPGVTMAKEIGGFDTSTGSSIRSYLLDTDRSLKQSMKHGTVKEKAGALMGLVDDNFVANLPNVADKVAWIEIWEACRRETAARNPKMETSSEAFKQKVGDRFTEVIRATQVYDSMFSKSPLLKSRNLGVQYVVSFMNEPNTVANMAEQAVRDIANKDFRKAGKAVGALTTSIVATNLLKSIIYAMRDEDEDETFREKYLSAVAGNLMSDGNLLNYIPIARDIWSIWEGYDVERSDMAIAADVVDAIQKLRKLNKEDIAKMTEEELEAWDKKVMDAQWRLAETLAPVVGIPLKNIRREILAVINTINVRELDKGRKSTELSIRHAIEEATGKAERSDRDKLYEALVSGDSAYVQRLKAGYESDSAYHSAIKMALRDHDSRVWKAAMAWNSNDLQKYMDIAKEIIGEGNFIQDDVVLAIRAEASSMEESGETAAAQKKGYFSNEKFGVAMGQNNTAMADIIQKDLIDTKVANGKTREEAQKSVQSTARSQLKELYELGEITGAVAQNMLVRYGGYDREDAKDKVAEWKYEADYPELDGRITYTQYKRWESDGKSRGVSLENFTKVTEYRGGDTSAGVRSQEEVAAYINAMPISTAQKDALWLCFWSEKTLYKNAPWH